MSVALTPRQQQVLDLIRNRVSQTGFPPTRVEIARALGFRSANAAEDHLKALARKGAITLTAGASRGIRLTPAAACLDVEPDASSNAFERLVLPLIGRVAAGSPILAVEHIAREVGVDPSLFSRKPDYLLTVRGESMRDAGILDGDLLAVKRASEARNGQIVVARIDEDVTVKRLQQQNGQIVLLPENADFAPITLRAGQEFALEGVVVGLIRTQSMF